MTPDPPEPKFGMVTPTEQPTPQAIRRSVQSDGVWVLTFDRPGAAANILDRETLRELEEQLESLERETQLRGLVLTSAKASVFVAGADLNAFRAGAPLDQVRSLIEQGQAVMNRLAALPVPTVAAIHGAALGGGCELALACDYRVASDDRATRIGFPETQLGLIPAWGGSTRLPRLVGLSKALELVLGGKPLPARQALTCGLVDELAPGSQLLDAAFRRVASGKPRRRRGWLLNSPLTAAWNARSSRRSLLARTRARSPAPLKALEIITRGFASSPEKAMTLERSAFMELVQTEACHNLVELFFLESRARRPDLSGAPAQSATKPIARAAVIGAGVMGAGIAHWLSTHRVEVSLEDVSADQLARGMARIRALYEEAAGRGLLTAVEMQEGLARIQASHDEGAPARAELVIEAAAENLAVKKEIFQRADRQAPPEAILATNTSALSIAELALVTRRPQQVVGLHFFNPVHRMQLVEVIAAPQTAQETLHRAVRFAQRIGKLPVIVKDSPGFVANRLLTPYLNEAQTLFANGVPAAQLDEAMMDFGLPMGPLRLLDEIGLDVELRIAETLAAVFGDRMAVPVGLREAVRAGWFGRKAGRGFYSYGEAKRPQVNRAASALAHPRSGPVLSREELQERMLFAMINEGARCLEEGIVGGPEDIDFVMVKGTGFTPFRGGPLRYADSLGADRLVGGMEHLVDTGLARFAPCALLRHLAVQGKSFYPATQARQVQPERKAA